MQAEVMIDILQKVRKPTRAKKTDVFLFKDPYGSVCLGIGKKKSDHQSFKIEETLSRIYDGKAGEGKASLELNLPGGTVANVMINNAQPVEALQEFLLICRLILEDVSQLHSVELPSFP
eukprot:TRINITY_DN4701_c0_g1_i1.p1 TRINITY_DN4701_c0_g1~~TRINITY_DN4701_c0_g1_i1.p1  ORF type:complete len:119 (-),score=31.95 TRINITY_DN4701_c0_g1_i1:160-516(-)